MGWDETRVKAVKDAYDGLLLHAQDVAKRWLDVQNLDGEEAAKHFGNLDIDWADQMVYFEVKWPCRCSYATCNHENYAFPVLYLWENGWEERLRQKLANDAAEVKRSKREEQENWRRALEQDEQKTYERLKAKYG